MHEALHSLSNTDQLVFDKFMQLENAISTRLIVKLNELGYDCDNLFEKVHIGIQIIQSYSHECVYDQHNYINYEIMRSLIISMLVDLFR